MQSSNEDLSAICPFPGLRPFTEHEARFYFGRDRQRDECIRRLQEHRFLAVLGSSGSGKSSLVRAGLLPALERGLLRGADERWRWVVMRPGPDPMAALATAVYQLRAGADAPVDQRVLADIEGTIRASSCGLTDAVSKVLDNGRPNVLLVVDQFEELFRLGKEQQAPQRWRMERCAFVQAILGAREAAGVPVYVVTTMRTDFLEDCTLYSGLPEALNIGQFLVPELTREQLESAVVEPVAKVGVNMSRALVRQVLSDATMLRDSLPVIQHALMRTWQIWKEKVACGEAKSDQIELEHYKAVGTAREALDRHGDEILANLDANEVAVTKRLFQRLTLTNADGKVTRSPTSFDTLCREAAANGTTDAQDVVRRVLTAFRAEKCRFLMPPPNEALEGSEIDVSHEAVFRIWRKLAGTGPGDEGWIAEEHRHRRIYMRLVDAAQLKQDKKGQLLDEESLTFMEKWWAQFNPKVEWAMRYHVFDQRAEAIVEQSRAALLSLLQANAEELRKKRAAIHQTYQAELDAWHSDQFNLAKKFLEASRAAKDAEHIAQLEATRKLARALRAKWYALAAIGVVAVSVFFLAREEKISTLGKQISRLEEDKKRLETDTSAARENAAAASSEAERAKAEASRAEANVSVASAKVVEAESKVAEAMRKEIEAANAEQKARQSLVDVNRQLESATRRVKNLGTDLDKTKKTLDERERVLGDREAEVKRQNEILAEQQAKLNKQGLFGARN